MPRRPRWSRDARAAERWASRYCRPINDHEVNPGLICCMYPLEDGRIERHPVVLDTWNKSAGTVRCFLLRSFAKSSYGLYTQSERHRSRYLAIENSPPMFNNLLPMLELEPGCAYLERTSYVDISQECFLDRAFLSRFEPYTCVTETAMEIIRLGHSQIILWWNEGDKYNLKWPSFGLWELMDKQREKQEKKVAQRAVVRDLFRMRRFVRRKLHCSGERQFWRCYYKSVERVRTKLLAQSGWNKPTRRKLKAIFRKDQRPKGEGMEAYARYQQDLINNPFSSWNDGVIDMLMETNQEMRRRVREERGGKEANRREWEMEGGEREHEQNKGEARDFGEDIMPSRLSKRGRKTKGNPRGKYAQAKRVAELFKAANWC